MSTSQLTTGRTMSQALVSLFLLSIGIVALACALAVACDMIGEQSAYSNTIGDKIRLAIRDFLLL